MNLTAKFVFALLLTTALAHSQTFPLPEKSLANAFAGRTGALVFTNTVSGASNVFNPKLAAEPLAPCSTFKIWNTLIGLENDLISSPDEPFYKWDGQTRSIATWNQDLTLKAAFQASCVPAFQELARKIGAEKMQLWVDKIGYGDRNTSAGIDVFWLPNPGRKTVLITPEEQAQLIDQLVTGKLPVSKKSRATLAEIMLIKKTDLGSFFGKTGTGTDAEGNYNLGWFVGYVETHGKTFTFACVLKGSKVMGKDARAIVETVLKENGYL